MWFLRNIVSGEKVSPDFSSQAKLARFMQILPQTLHKAIQEKRNVFKFRERNVRVVQEKIPHWALYSSSETLIETFETVSDLAKWLKVTTQAVYAAINRGLKPQIKNKEGTVFWLRKFQEGEAADSPRPPLPTPQPPPVPAPRKKNLPPPVPAPRPPPVPAPRKKNLPPPPQRKNLPPSREISPMILSQNESEERQQRIAEIQRKYVWAPKDGAYEDDMREVEELLRQEEHYTALRLKYFKWFLDKDVNMEQEETQMVLYNEDTGEDVPVKNYEDIANYFQSKEYIDFLSRDRFNATLRQGKIKFWASTEGLALESWTRFIFIKDPAYA